MDKKNGLLEIDLAQWETDDYGWQNLVVHDSKDRPVKASLSLRPPYCDRGHIQLLVDGCLNLDAHDSFPRFFFNKIEADHHLRVFLKWRLWGERTYPHTL